MISQRDETIKNLEKTHFKDNGNNMVDNKFRPVYCDSNCQHSGKINRTSYTFFLPHHYKDLFGNTVIEFLEKILEDLNKITLNKI